MNIQNFQLLQCHIIGSFFIIKNNQDHDNPQIKEVIEVFKGFIFYLLKRYMSSPPPPHI